MPPRVVQYPSSGDPPPLPPPFPVDGWNPVYPVTRPRCRTVRQPPALTQPDYPYSQNTDLQRESPASYPSRLRPRVVKHPPPLTQPDYPFETTNTTFFDPLCVYPARPRSRVARQPLPLTQPDAEPPTTRDGRWGWQPQYPERLRKKRANHPAALTQPDSPFVGISPPPPPGTTFTGQIGIYLSRAANVVPGFYSTPLSPPTPPTVYDTHPPAFAPSLPRLQSFAFSFAPALQRRPFVGTYPAAATTEQVAAAVTLQAYPVPFAPGPRRDGPFSRLPRLVEPHDNTNQPVSPPPPVVAGEQVYAPFFRPFGVFARTDVYRFAPLPSLPVSPDSGGYYNPTVPPPPPPVPDGPLIGPSRVNAPSVPRAPEAEDPRVRPHIDKVAVLLNDLLRKGYIRQVGRDQFEIAGGGFQMPRPPSVYDDNTVGGFIGAIYVDTTTQLVYVCVNASTGSAVWKLIG